MIFGFFSKCHYSYYDGNYTLLETYQVFYNGFYAPYFHIQLLGCNTKITDKHKLNVFMHTWHLWVFHDDINVNVGPEVFQANSWQQFFGERIEM